MSYMNKSPSVNLLRRLAHNERNPYKASVLWYEVRRRERQDQPKRDAARQTKKAA